MRSDAKSVLSICRAHKADARITLHPAEKYCLSHSFTVYSEETLTCFLQDERFGKSVKDTATVYNLSKCKEFLQIDLKVIPISAFHATINFSRLRRL